MKNPAKLDLDNYLPYLVNRVGTIIADQFGGEALTPYRLSIAMWRVMAVLATRADSARSILPALPALTHRHCRVWSPAW